MIAVRLRTGIFALRKGPGYSPFAPAYGDRVVARKSQGESPVVTSSPEIPGSIIEATLTLDRSGPTQSLGGEVGESGVPEDERVGCRNQAVGLQQHHRGIDLGLLGQYRLSLAAASVQGAGLLGGQNLFPWC